MIRTYNIGTECYGLLTCGTCPEFLLPVKLIILEKFTIDDKVTYKVKIREIFENDFEYLKEYIPILKLSTNISSQQRPTTFIKKSKIDTFETKTELLTYLNDKPFLLEDIYITLDKTGLKDLYLKFVRYIINHHYKKIFQLTSRSFLSNTPLFENQKNMFKKRVDKIGFGDLFKQIDLDLDI